MLTTNHDIYMKSVRNLKTFQYCEMTNVDYVSMNVRYQHVIVWYWDNTIIHK